MLESGENGNPLEAYNVSESVDSDFGAKGEHYRLINN